MTKYLLYKEWLKVKWVIAGALLLFLLIAIYTFLTIRSAQIQTGANDVWYKFLFINPKFYQLYQLPPIIFGGVLAFFQFMPELNQKRLRLSLHLPMDQKQTLFIMIVFGETVLIFGLFFLFLSFAIFTSFVLPAQLIHAGILSILPWGLAGILCYNYLVILLLEPVLTQRFFHFCMGLVLIFYFLQNAAMEGLNYQLISMAIITFVSMVGILHTGNRFGKIHS